MTTAPGPVVLRVRAAHDLIARADRPEIWIDLRPRDEVETEARTLDARLTAGEHLPLAGRLLAVKGNIDVAGLPTTAGCPAYAYTPDHDAPAVARLRAAGAIVLGTTNLDQFATGLTGTRSPVHGAVRGAVDPARISGGSSSGSAVAVALGMADLALGTDTAGSGRVPAAFNGIVGLKPTPRLVSTEGVVPACASLDCVSVFARTLPEAEQALGHLITGPAVAAPARAPGPWRIAVPDPAALGELDSGWDEAYRSAAARLEAAGAALRTVDPAPFLDAATLLYDGAFVAERYAAVGEFLEALGTDVPDLDPTVAGIIRRARDIPAHRLFTDRARLAELRSRALASLGDADALLLPTAPGHPTLAAVAADPLGANARLGRFTNSTNLFGMAAVAVPGGTVSGLPFGVMLIGHAHTDERLARIAALLTPATRIAVAGAHLTGQPLNPQLLSHGAHFVRTTTTAPRYRLHALPTDPPKPGLERVTRGGRVEVEIWELPANGLGGLVAALPQPMVIGKVELADGTLVPGFLCEPAALGDGSRDITAYGGWRAYLAATS
ncbi:allophanate hydrolase [Streptomyces sp. NBC_00838]|uniref:allophanate hydrolase n=1 Tax=Streptomyces sp. NBC_00838 TaxID=2903680 RepID=UPI003869B48E|nr:allophanate hydrolase [Streptomyces sp. NBC_00838]